MVRGTLSCSLPPLKHRLSRVSLDGFPCVTFPDQISGDICHLFAPLDSGNLIHNRLINPSPENIKHISEANMRDERGYGEDDFDDQQGVW